VLANYDAGGKTDSALGITGFFILENSTAYFLRAHSQSQNTTHVLALKEGFYHHLNCNDAAKA
jgi:hypothetical protein